VVDLVEKGEHVKPDAPAALACGGVEVTKGMAGAGEELVGELERPTPVAIAGGIAKRGTSDVLLEMTTEIVAVRRVALVRETMTSLQVREIKGKVSFS
jgi:hypothetical protein